MTIKTTPKANGGKSRTGLKIFRNRLNDKLKERIKRSDQHHKDMKYFFFFDKEDMKYFLRKSKLLADNLCT